MSDHYELWQQRDRNHSSPLELPPAFPWMVYSVSGAKCRWFPDEESARAYFTGVVSGVKDRGDSCPALSPTDGPA